MKSVDELEQYIKENCCTLKHNDRDVTLMNKENDTLTAEPTVKRVRRDPDSDEDL